MKKAGKERNKRARTRDVKKNGRRDQRSQSRGTGEVEDISREGRRNGGGTIRAAEDPATLRRER